MCTLKQTQIQHIFRISKTHHLSAPDSDASTIPASTSKARKLAVQGTLEVRAKDSQDTQVTPLPKLKKSPSELDGESSKPKLSKAVQSSAILEPKLQSGPPTAAKARAAKPPVLEPPVKVEPSTPQASLAVQECLRRPSTTDFPSTPTPTPKTTEVEREKKKKNEEEPAEEAPAPQDVQPTAASAPDDDESSSDSEEDRKKEQQAKAKREAHARYMRFSRSLTSILA